ncbi:MAG: extracellular solute-binding protein [Oscillospiraceae bacterium]|jgi:hypothetical protein|nr:extracellular solute-binding protein [Oscillospiraceae bacterium]
MKRSLSQALAILLALAMSLSIAACSPSDSGDTPGGSTTGSPGAAPTPDVNATGFVYVPDYLRIPAEITEMNNAAYIDGKVLFTSNTVVGSYEVDYGAGGGGGFGAFGFGGFGFAAPAPMPSVDTEPGTDTAEGEEGEENAEPTSTLQTVDLYEQRIFSINPDGTGYEETKYRPPEVPEGAPQGSTYYLNSIKFLAGGQAVVSEAGYFGYMDEDTQQYVDNTVQKLRKIDLNTGAVLAEYDTSPILAGNPYGGIGMMGADADGNLYLSSYDGSIFLYGADGTFSAKAALPGTGGYVQSLIVLPDGTVAATVWGNTGDIAIYPVDFAGKKVGSSIGNFPNNIGTYGGLGSGKDELLFYDQIALYTTTIGSTDKKEVVNWIDSDASGDNLTYLGITENEDVLCFTQSYNFNYGGGGVMMQNNAPAFELIRLVKTPANQVAVKTTISLAVNNVDYTLRSAIIDFNKKNPNYRVKINDYSQYNTATDYTLGLTKLNTEIISGTVPDMIYSSGGELPIENYAVKGLLDDLYPYLDADTTLGGREAIVPFITKALEIDGKLYRVSPGFSLQTLTVDGSKFGTADGWDMTEFDAARSQMPAEARVFPYYFARNDVLDMVLSYNIESYVDLATGKCTFDTPDFAALLDYIKTLQETFEWSQNMPYIDENQDILNGKQLAQMTYINQFDQFLNAFALFNGTPAFKGYPSADKNGNAFQPNYTLSISAKSPNKDGAWQFISSILSDEFQSNGQMWTFPTNQKSFDAAAKTAMTETTLTSQGYGWYDGDNDGEIDEIQPKGTIYINDGTMTGKQIPYYAMTQAQYDRIMTFLNGITKVYSRDQKLLDLIREDTGPFFAGQKSAGEVTAIIQNRASIYVAEQR